MIAALALVAAANPLAGAWTLDHLDAVMVADGRVVPNAAVEDPAHAKGIIIYDPSGWMAVEIGAGGRAPEPGGVSGRTHSIATGSYYAYWGRYVIDTGAQTVRHVVSDSLMPPEIGRSFLRHYTIAGNMLTLVSDPVDRPEGRLVNRITFHRLSPDTASTGPN